MQALFYQTVLNKLLVQKVLIENIICCFSAGSAEERKVVEFVNRFSKNKKKRNIYKKDLKAEMTVDAIVPDDKFVGDDIDVGVRVKNVTEHDKNLKVHLTLASTFYTGVMGKKVEGEKTEHFIKAGEGNYHRAS